MKNAKKDIRICPVCKTENSTLSVTCTSCGGYLRDKVASLHLFQTLWILIESPYASMQRIIVSQQKNYIFLLQMMFGFAYVAFAFWFSNIGLLVEDLQTIFALIIILGPVSGILLITVLSMIVTAIVRFKTGELKFRDIRSIISYAGFPIILSVLFVFPGEVAIFGNYLFMDEPSLFNINPAVYIIMLGLNAFLIIWSLVLLYIGVRVLTGISGLAFVVSLLSIGILMLPAIALSSIISIYGSL